MKIPIKLWAETENGSALTDTDSLFAKKGTLLRELIEGFGYSAAAFLLGYATLPFGAQPLGVGFLCAANKKLPYIFSGLCLSALFSEHRLILICAYFAVLLVRILTRLTIDVPWGEGEDSSEISLTEILPTLFSENLFLRMATSCVGVFVIGLYSLIDGGFLYYDLFGAIVSMISAPACVILLHGIFSEKEMPMSYKYVSAAAPAFGLIYSARDIKLWGVSVAAFSAMILSLYVCRKKGLLYGIGAGAVCGLAYSPMLAPAFFLAALGAGALWRVSVFFACSAAFAIGIAWGVYTNGISTLTSLMPALLSASLLFAVIDKTILQGGKTAEGSKDTEKETDKEKDRTVRCALASNELIAARLDASITRQRALCETFSNMSSFFFELGEKMKTPLIYDTKNICDSAFDASCANCRCNTICWEERHTDTMAAVTSLSAALHREGRISGETIPENLRSVCERLPDIIDEINHNYSQHARQLLLCDKTEIFALDYKAISDLLAAGIELENREYTCNRELSQKVCERLEDSKADVSSAVVFGSKKKRVLLCAKSIESLEKNKKALLSELEILWGSPLVCEYIRENDEGGAVMSVTQKRKIRAEYAQSAVSSKFEKDFCGDSMAVFETDEDMLYSMVSDGMGSGRDAALSSGISVMFMKKMLSTSASCESALHMLNGFLRNKGSGSVHECSATVDIMELDLVTSRAYFYKSGAAPSYVLRNGNFFKIRSRTVPLGIIKELDSKRTSIEVLSGDVIVMISDGVNQGKEDCPWLYELLKKNIDVHPLEHCAKLISDRAKKINASDDISVTLIKICDP